MLNNHRENFKESPPVWNKGSYPEVRGGGGGGGGGKGGEGGKEGKEEGREKTKTMEGKPRESRLEIQKYFLKKKEKEKWASDAESEKNPMKQRPASLGHHRRNWILRRIAEEAAARKRKSLDGDVTRRLLYGRWHFRLSSAMQSIVPIDVIDTQQ